MSNMHGAAAVIEASTQPARDYYTTSTGIWPPLADLMDRAQSAEPLADSRHPGAENTPQREKSASAVDDPPATSGQNPPQEREPSTLLGDAAVAAAYDPVTRPAHYALSPEPLDVIEAWGLPHHEACILKYITRWRDKGGVQDLRKAAEYLRRLIAVAERG